MFVVLGATGRTGSAAAEVLLQQGARVRLLIRDAARAPELRSRGFEVAVADLLDVPSVQRALLGATAAFVLVPPDLETHDLIASRRELIDRLVQALAQSSLEHVVYLSGWGAHQSDGRGPIRYLHYGEGKLQGLGRAVTTLRPGAFYENWASVLPLAVAHGVLPTALALDGKLPMVSCRDIGELAATCLMQGPRQRVVELAGPEEYSPRDVAAALSVVCAREVTPQLITSEELIGALVSFGVSDEVASQQAELVRTMNAGQYRWQGGDAEFQRGATGIHAGLAGMLRLTQPFAPSPDADSVCDNNSSPAAC